MRTRGRGTVLGALAAFLLVTATGAWMATTEAGAALLLYLLEVQSSSPRLDVVKAEAQAIVVLGGRTNRVHEGARLSLATGVPIALVGKGTGDSGFEAESEKMEDILLRQYGIGPRWVETESKDTRENALFAWCLLSSFGVKKIALVTHAYHMPRARRRFASVGFDVIAAPVPDASVVHFEKLTRESFIPSRKGMQAARMPLHEWAGFLLGPVDRWIDPPRPCPYAPMVPK